MLIITVATESFDEETNEFVSLDEVTLELEHSLATLSKWESIHETPFLVDEPKTNEELMSYIQIMVQTPDVAPEVFNRLSAKNYKEINDYINAKMSATWFNESQLSAKSSEIITSELIYYWLTVFNIPFDPVEHWHLNRAFTLIKVANHKNSKPKKMSRNEVLQRQRELNARRREEHGTTG